MPYRGGKEIFSHKKFRQYNLSSNKGEDRVKRTIEERMQTKDPLNNFTMREIRQKPSSRGKGKSTWNTISLEEDRRGQRKKGELL